MTISALPLTRPHAPAPHTRSCTASDLAAAGLGLRLLGPDDTDASVTWVTETEQADPTPHVVRGSLVLTRGRRLRTVADQVTFVHRVGSAGASCVGFGLDGPLRAVPPPVVSAAADAGLAVLTVAAGTPFAAISRYVADQVIHRADCLTASRQAQAQTVLLETVLSTGSVQATVAALSRSLGQHVRVVDPQGGIIAQYPPAHAVATPYDAHHLGARPRGGETRTPITAGGVPAGYLITPEPPDSADMLHFAVGLIGLELARHAAELSGRRELAGQVIEDIVRRALSQPEAERRLARHGVVAAEPHAVVLGRFADPRRDLSRQVLPLPIDRAENVGLSAHVDGALCLVVPESGDPDEYARMLHAHLVALGGTPHVGAGTTLPGADGLRTSYLEAREGLSRGPGVNPRRALSLSGLLMAQEQPAMAELARECLQPLIEADQRTPANLMGTVRVLIDEDFSIARAAETLVVHRNTVKYRVAQIERLTGLDLSATAGRMQLWLAVATHPAGEAGG